MIKFKDTEGRDIYLGDSPTGIGPEKEITGQGEGSKPGKPITVTEIYFGNHRHLVQGDIADTAAAFGVKPEKAKKGD
jgi:hypothetical protein